MHMKCRIDSLIAAMYIYAVFFLNTHLLFYTDLPPRFPNIGYVGSTYNIFKGNPRNTKGLDPGFTLRTLYEYSYNNENTTVDGTYLIPDHTQATTSTTCSFQFSSETNQKIDSYFNSLKIDANADFSGWGASFSASANYKEVHESSTTQESTYVSSHAACEAYITSVQLEAAALNPAFVDTVQYLPPQSPDSTDYLDFIQYWGTHVAIQVTMGGRYGVQSTITSQDYSNMVSTGLDIKAAAKYSGLKSLNVNVGTSIEKEQAEKFNSFRKDYQIYQIGGKPPLDESQSPFNWAKTVKDNPLPLKYNLLPITNFFTSRFFPDDEDISQKKINLQNTFVEYCQSLDLPDPSYCINNGPTSSPRIQVTFTNKKTDILCGPIDAKFVVPVVNNPDYRILGTYRRYELKNDETVIVNGRNAPAELIRNAIGWDHITWGQNYAFFRPVCDNGFFSISDFICCGNDTSCLSKLPIALPCIAEKCISECGYTPDGKGYHTAAISFGSAVYGNAFPYKIGASSNHAYRYITDEYKLDPKEHKCLNNNCLTYI